MAEVFGVVVASAQLLALAASSITKAKHLCDEIDQAPSEIRELMEEIQAFSPILAALGSLHRHESGRASVHVKSGLECYSKAHAALDDLVQSLVDEIATARGRLRLKAAAAKIVLRGRSVARLEAKLRRAKEVLELALSLSTLDWTRRCYEVASETQSLLRDTRQDDNDGDGRISHENSTVAHGRTAVSSAFGDLSCGVNDSAYTITICLPHWLTGAVWSFWVRKLSWDLHFRHYNIRSATADIFAAVRSGYVEKMLLLFNRRHASPFDCDSEGTSLLYYAAISHQPAICKILLNLGLRELVDEDPGTAITPRQAAYVRFLSQTRNKEGNRDVVDLFLDPARRLPNAHDCRFFLYGCSRGSVDLTAVCQFQKEVAPEYFELPLRQRLEAARGYAFSGHSRRHPDATVFKFLIRRDAGIRPADYGPGVDDGYSLIHSIAISLGRTYREFTRSPKESDVEREGRWLQLLRLVLRKPSRQTLYLVEHVQNQYSIDVGRLPCDANWIGTPLLSLLRGCVAESLWDASAGSGPFKKQWEKWQSILDCALKHWLIRLVELGVDLEEYGRREREVLRSLAGERAAARDFSWVSSWWSASKKANMTKYLPVRLCHFQFDASPSEWSFVWDIDVEQLSGDFWRLVEKQNAVHKRIPGQWID